MGILYFLELGRRRNLSARRRHAIDRTRSLLTEQDRSIPIPGAAAALASFAVHESLRICSGGADLSFPSATKARYWPPGDQNGLLASSVPASVALLAVIFRARQFTFSSYFLASGIGFIRSLSQLRRSTRWSPEWQRTSKRRLRIK